MKPKTLHDEFAMAALTGLLAYSHVNPQYGNFVENCSTENACRIAYDYADAMMKERQGYGQEAHHGTDVE